MKDHRPDLMQMVLALVIDGEGRPICTEIWPGNSADVTTLIPVVDRFGIVCVCIVADRGMIAAATIETLEDRNLEYVLNVRERSDRLMRSLVLDDAKPFTPLCITRLARGRHSFGSRR